MEEKQYKLFDIFIKLLGFIITACSIYIGLSNVNKQHAAALELEFKRNFWKTQSDVYTEVCKSAGCLVANAKDTAEFKRQKANFLSLYYGDMILVEDRQVDSAMHELKSYLEIIQPLDLNMVQTLETKVVALSEACKLSLDNYKQASEK